jgi:hypothetical protein
MQKGEDDMGLHLLGAKVQQKNLEIRNQECHRFPWI